MIGDVLQALQLDRTVTILTPEDNPATHLKAVHDAKRLDFSGRTYVGHWAFTSSPRTWELQRSGRPQALEKKSTRHQMIIYDPTY